MDTFLDSNNPNQNYGDGSTINVEGGSTLVFKQRALLKFDLSSIPSGMIITKATLKMYATGYWTPITTQTLTVYRVTQDWDELQATWNNRLTGTGWTGTDPAGAGGTWTTTGSVAQTAVSSGLTPIIWDVTDIVKAWVESAQDNFGFIVKLTDESGSNYWQQFASSTYYDSESRPILDVQYPIVDIEQNGVPVNTLDLPVGSTFMVDVWIRNLPNQGLNSIYFAVEWDPTMMELVSYQEAANPQNTYDAWGVGSGVDYIEFYALGFSGTFINYDMLYLTLTFRCLIQGSSPVTVTHSSLSFPELNYDVNPPDFVLTCNQLSRAPSNPPQHVGGEVFSANKLAVLSPYLALIGSVTIAAVLVKRRKI